MKRSRSRWDPVVFEELTCTFCRGRGRDPFDIMSSLSTCCVCGGSGKIRVQAPAIACAHYRGTVAVKTFTRTTCGGRGSVRLPSLPTVSCPVCKGSGDDAFAQAMACLKCRGTGWMMEQFRKEQGVHE
jgi:DnaJ-class molecular chaperone